MPIHFGTANNSKMAIHKQHQPSSNAITGFNHSYKESTNGFIRSTQQPKPYQPRRSQRLAKQRIARTPRMLTMESENSSHTSCSSTRTPPSTFMWKQTKAAIRPPKPKPRSQPKSKPEPKPPDPAQPSFLEQLTDREVSHALSYYYDYPQNLPYRECGAHVRANGPVPDVLVKFDENIFSRKACLRPLPEDDLESVDPFTLDTGKRR